jgi:hypothetical protein
LVDVSSADRGEDVPVSLNCTSASLIEIGEFAFAYCISLAKVVTDSDVPELHFTRQSGELRHLECIGEH